MQERLYEMTLQQCLERYRQGWQFYVAAGGVVGTRMETAALNPQSHSTATQTHLYYKGETEHCKHGNERKPAADARNGTVGTSSPFQIRAADRGGNQSRNVDGIHTGGALFRQP